MKIFLSSNQGLLSETLKEYARTATVEAEYGSFVVRGSVITLAHHGANWRNPAPCERENDDLNLDAIGLSHCDLDSLGGVLSLMGNKPEDAIFWRMAAYVDVKGPHMLGNADFPGTTKEMLHAWWAWSRKNPFYAPRDGSVVEANEWVEKGRKVLEALLGEDSEERRELIAAGREFLAEEQNLNEGSFVRYHDVGLVVRTSEHFVNHLYACPNGRAGRCVINLNPKTGAITLSFASNDEGFSAKDIMQEVFGPEAGGHMGIAGSPRNAEMTTAELEALEDYVLAYLEVYS